MLEMSQGAMQEVMLKSIKELGNNACKKSSKKVDNKVCKKQYAYKVARTQARQCAIKQEATMQ